METERGSKKYVFHKCLNLKYSLLPYRPIDFLLWWVFFCCLFMLCINAFEFSLVGVEV